LNPCLNRGRPRRAAPTVRWLKLTAVCLAVFLACSASSSTPLKKRARAFDCRNQNAYKLVVVANPNRMKGSDPTIPQDLNIVVGDEVISKIELPIADSEAKNFSLNSVEKTRVGFEIKADWGGGVYHYELEFNFRCKNNGFYLHRIKKVSYSTTNPDRGFLDKKKTKVTRIQPNLPIEKFVMTKYL
jgi:hypothetical protein